MSGTYPTTPEFQAINVESKQRNIYSETVSGRIQARQIGKQQWAFSAKYNPMTREEFAPVYAFLVSQKGRFGTFTIVPPVISTTSGTATGTMTSGAENAGSTSISVSGFTGDIKAGDFVKFASHSKVYMVTADRSGAGDMSIEPALIEAVTNGTEITYTDVPFKMRLNNDIQTYSLSSNEYFEVDVDMIEDI